MDPNLQEPLKRLAQALHGAIEESRDVEQAIESLREQGFQAHLLLEVTVALGRAQSDERQMELSDVGGWEVEIEGDDGAATAPEVSDDDRAFLRAIRIRIDD